jgi:hypothetical protein
MPHIWRGSKQEVVQHHRCRLASRRLPPDSANRTLSVIPPSRGTQKAETLAVVGCGEETRSRSHSASQNRSQEARVIHSENYSQATGTALDRPQCSVSLATHNNLRSAARKDYCSGEGLVGSFGPLLRGLSLEHALHCRWLSILAFGPRRVSRALSEKASYPSAEATYKASSISRRFCQTAV